MQPISKKKKKKENSDPRRRERKEQCTECHLGKKRRLSSILGGRINHAGGGEEGENIEVKNSYDAVDQETGGKGVIDEIGGKNTTSTLPCRRGKRRLSTHFDDGGEE